MDSVSNVGFAVGRMQELVDPLRTCPVPVVSRVRGRAYGAGCMLCMASDAVVATPDAEFGLQE